jgi:integrase
VAGQGLRLFLERIADAAGNRSGEHDQERASNHSLRATGITDYLRSEGTLEHAQAMANHSSPRTTKLYDRREDEVSLDEYQRVGI